LLDHFRNRSTNCIAPSPTLRDQDETPSEPFVPIAHDACFNPWYTIDIKVLLQPVVRSSGPWGCSGGETLASPPLCLFCGWAAMLLASPAVDISNLFRLLRHPTHGCNGTTFAISLILFLADLLAIALTCQRFFHSLFLARFQVERMALNFLDDVFSLHLALEAAQGILKGFAFLNSNFCQRGYTSKQANNRAASRISRTAGFDT